MGGGRRKQAPPAAPVYPRVLETFRDPRWALEGRALFEPSCINGEVLVERFRITIDKIDEPLEVIRDRLVKLWRESERNSHTWGPMRAAACRLLGLDDAGARELLKLDDQAIDHKDDR